MLVIAIICGVILVTYAWFRGRRAEQPGRFLLRLVWVGLAGGIGETTCIRWYGFYAYEADWGLFFDQVPILVLTIWPFVIHSAWDLSRYLLGREHRAVPLLGAAIVLVDASLIEPIAVAAGLWHWTEPGLFLVPPIGIIGWSLFALACLYLWQQADQRRLPLWVDASTMLVAPAFSHLGLLAIWWGALRWVNQPMSSWAAVVAVWLLSLAVTTWLVRQRAAQRVPLSVLLLRVPPTLFFTGLLLLHGRDQPALILYVVAFAPPYLVLTFLRDRRSAVGLADLTPRA